MTLDIVILGLLTVTYGYSLQKNSIQLEDDLRLEHQASPLVDARIFWLVFLLKNLASTHFVILKLPLHDKEITL